MGQFIIVQFTLPALSHQVPSNYILVFKRLSEPLEHCDFFNPQGRSWRSPYQTQNNIDYLQIEIFKVNPHRDNNIVVPTICVLSKQNLPQLIYQRFGDISITILKLISIKGLIEGLP